MQSRSPLGIRSLVEPAGRRRLSFVSAATAVIAAAGLTLTVPSAGAAGASTGARASASAPAATPGRTTALALDARTRAALKAAFVRSRAGTSVAMPASLVDGPLRYGAHYAYLASDRSYWAIAYFAPRPGASTSQQVSFQDAGAGAVFTRPFGGTWRVVGAAGGGGAFPCPGQLAPALLRVWHLRVDTRNCLLELARAPRSERGTVSFVTTDAAAGPAGTFRGLLDLEQISVARTGEIWLDAESSDGRGGLVNRRPLRMSVVSISPTTRTEYSIGTSAASSRVIEGHFDKAFADRVARDFRRSDVTFLVTVGRGGVATYVQEISPVTPTGDAAYREP